MLGTTFEMAELYGQQLLQSVFLHSALFRAAEYFEVGRILGKLTDHLKAHAAWHSAVFGGYCDALDLAAACTHHLEDSGSLGAHGGAKRGVFHVAGGVDVPA